MAAQDLSAVLWHERELLDLLTFKLEEEQLLLTAGRTRWLSFATREVEQVVERLRQTALERSVAVSELALEWGSSPDATLREIITAADPIWADVFAQHLAALLEQTSAITELRDANVNYLRSASRSTQEALANLNPDAGTYDARGDTNRADARASIFNEVL